MSEKFSVGEEIDSSDGLSNIKIIHVIPGVYCRDKENLYEIDLTTKLFPSGNYAVSCRYERKHVSEKYLNTLIDMGGIWTTKNGVTKYIELLKNEFPHIKWTAIYEYNKTRPTIRGDSLTGLKFNVSDLEGQTNLFICWEVDNEGKLKGPVNSPSNKIENAVKKFFIRSFVDTKEKMKMLELELKKLDIIDNTLI